MSIQHDHAVHIRVEEEMTEVHKIMGLIVEKQRWSLMSCK